MKKLFYDLIVATVASPMMLTGHGIAATGRGIKTVGQKVEDTGVDVTASGAKLAAKCHVAVAQLEAEAQRMRPMTREQAMAAAQAEPIEIDFVHVTPA